MPSILVFKNTDGKLQGFGERGERAYNRFLADVRRLEVGEMLAFSYKPPRSPKFHRRHFAMLGIVFESQEAFTDELIFRKWGEVGAGYCEMVPGKDGLIAVPKSIDYETLDDIAFADVHLAVKAYLRDEHARGVLWPHLRDEQRYEMIEQLLMEFD